MTMADRVVVMSRGHAEQVGPPQEIYQRPVNAFVADFIGRTNFWDARVQGGRLRMGDLSLSMTPPAQFIDGAPVRAACRPEKARIDGGAEGNTVAAKVTFVRTIGPTRDIHLETPFGAMVVESAVGSESYAIGQTVALHLPPDAIQVFPADVSSAEAA